MTPSRAFRNTKTKIDPQMYWHIKKGKKIEKEKEREKEKKREKSRKKRKKIECLSGD